MMEKKNPKWLKLMIKYFDYLKINVVTITYDELKDLPSSADTHLIVSESTLISKKRFIEAIKGYLGFALKNNLFSIHHISSFSAPELPLRNSTKSYYFYRMPFLIAPFCLQITQEFLQKNEEKTKWPGGKRAKLPVN